MIYRMFYQTMERTRLGDGDPGRGSEITIECYDSDVAEHRPVQTPSEERLLAHSSGCHPDLPFVTT